MVFFHIESGAGVGCVKLKVSGSSEVYWKSTEEVSAALRAVLPEPGAYQFPRGIPPESGKIE